jgi:hypothetical protein
VEEDLVKAAQSKAVNAAQCNLSDPQFDYDLVVAMTQKSVNTGLKNFLDKGNFPEVKVCFVTEERKWVLLPYDELKQRAKGSDPFTPKDGADPDKDPDLINLRAAHYAGGFVAQIGFPYMEDPLSLNVVTLKGGTETVANFNLLCQEFRITGFLYDADGATWINQSQPDKIPTGRMPWYFSADVQLKNTVIDANSPQLPAAVKAKVGQLQPGVFSLQQMYLDLNTAVETSKNLTVKGVDSSSPLYIELTAVFVKHYVEEMKKSGHPVLGYAVTMNDPDAGTMQLGAVSREFCPLLDSTGNPYANPTPGQQELTTFDYLCTTKKVPPKPKPFPWNWVDSDAISGILAFRRSSFGAVLASSLASALDPNFCLNTGFVFQTGADVPNYDPNKIYPNWHIGFPGQNKFEVQAPPGAPVAPEQFVSLLNFRYDDKEYKDSDWHGPPGLKIRLEVTANYSFSGTASIGVSRDAVPCIRLKMEAALQLGMNYWEMENLTPYHNLPLDTYFDYTVALDMPMKVDSSKANLIVEPGTPNVRNNSKNPAESYYREGILSGEVNRIMPQYLQKIWDVENKKIKSNFEYISQTIESAINGAHGFVFPGGKVFAFENASLSDYQDLIIHVSSYLS